MTCEFEACGDVVKYGGPGIQGEQVDEEEKRWGGELRKVAKTAGTPYP